MARDLTGAALEAITSEAFKPILFIEAMLDSGPFRFCTAPPPMSFEIDGNSFLGTGGIGQISAIGETTDLSVEGWEITFSGVPAESEEEIDAINLALGEPVQGRQAKAWLGLLDVDNALIADPILLSRARCDTIAVQMDGQTATVSMTVENRIADWDRPRTRRFTHEDQKTRFPNDLGLEFVSQATEAELDWGEFR